MDGSKNYGLKPNQWGCKTIKAAVHDIAILERKCKE